MAVGGVHHGIHWGDPRSNVQVQEEDGSFLFRLWSGRFSVYAFKYADQFIEAAEPMLEARVFLEVTTIVQIFESCQRICNSLDLCRITFERGPPRGSPTMTKQCK
jgi:hypothetical protein